MRPSICITHGSRFDTQKATKMFFHVLKVNEATNDAGVDSYRLSGGIIYVHYNAKSLWTPVHHIHRCLLFEHPIADLVPIYLYNNVHSSGKPFL